MFCNYTQLLTIPLYRHDLYLVLKEHEFIERKFEEEISRREEVQLKLQDLHPELQQSTTAKNELNTHLKQSERDKQTLHQQVQEAQKESKNIENLRSVQSDRLQGLQERCVDFMSIISFFEDMRHLLTSELLTSCDVCLSDSSWKSVCTWRKRTVRVESERSQV